MTILHREDHHLQLSNEISPEDDKDPYRVERTLPDTP